MTSNIMNEVYQMMSLRIQIDTLEEKTKELRKKYDELRLRTIPDLMAEENLRTLAGDFGRLSLRSDLYIKVNDKECLHRVLKKEGYGDLIQPTVNANSLKAFVKEQQADPDGLHFQEGVMTITPFSVAVIYPK